MVWLWGLGCQPQVLWFAVEGVPIGGILGLYWDTEKMETIIFY